MPTQPTMLIMTIALGTVLQDVYKTNCQNCKGADRERVNDYRCKYMFLRAHPFFVKDCNVGIKSKFFPRHFSSIRHFSFLLYSSLYRPFHKRPILKEAKQSIENENILLTDAFNYPHLRTPITYLEAFFAV